MISYCKMMCLNLFFYHQIFVHFRDVFDLHSQLEAMEPETHKGTGVMCGAMCNKSPSCYAPGAQRLLAPHPRCLLCSLIFYPTNLNISSSWRSGRSVTSLT